MKLLKLIIPLSIILFSCNDDTPSADVIDTEVRVYLFNEQNENLIDKGLIDIDNINVYNKKEGEFIPFYNHLYTRPKGLSIIDETDTTFLGLHSYAELINNKGTTVLDWGIEGYTPDTLELTYSKSPGSMVCIAVALNGEEVWNVENPVSLYRDVHIVK